MSNVIIRIDVCIQPMLEGFFIMFQSAGSYWAIKEVVMYRESRDVTHHVTCYPSQPPPHTDTADMVTYGSCETVPGPRIVGDTKTTTATELELLRKVDQSQILYIY